MKILQTTLKRRVNFQGVGLHSGKQVRCILHPAPAGHGIVFLRSDQKKLTQIRADISKVVRTDMCTTLGNSEGVVVATVEHLLAAIKGLGLDNVLIEVDAAEVPIMDGSALEFTQGILDAGIKELSVSRKVLRLRKKISVRHNDKWVSAEPSNQLSISAGIEFKHKVIGAQKFEFSNSERFLTDVASARTFGFLREVEYLHKKGLALGGSLDNAIVLDEERVLNPNGLRFNDEFVRHKVLDALGDFALLGLNLEAKIQIHKSGHEIHAGFLKKVLEDPSNYEILELKAEKSVEEVAEEIAAGFIAGAYSF